MIKDLYIRNPEDPNYKYGVFEHSDAIESIISKIKVLFSTKPGQVFGDIQMGLDIESLIFETKINKFNLEEKIKTQIQQYISEYGEYDIKPDIRFGKADGYDYAIIDIIINSQRVIGFLVK